MELPPSPQLKGGNKGGNYSAPNWALFRREMMRSPIYNRMRLNCTPEGTLAGNRLENAASIESDDWELIGREWTIFLQSTPDEYKPSRQEVVEFEKLAKFSRMPFSFNQNGSLKLNL